MGATFAGVGKLSKEPKMQYTPQGTALTFISFPVRSGWGENQKTTWVSCSLFGNMAENANKYLQKGSRVFVTGEITEINAYTKNDSTIGSELRVRVTQIDFLDGVVSKEESENEPEEF